MKIFKDIGIQVESDYLTPKFSTCIKSDQQLSTLTGLSSFAILNTIEQLVIKVQSMRGTSNSSIKFDLRELLIMTFMKLKQNMSYSTLAIFFNFSKNGCKSQIWKMIDILYLALKPSIHWPSKENILKNI
ncbi:GSCOCG00011781001-RA-CDS, partial [Cotesia congregata]